MCLQLQPGSENRNGKHFSIIFFTIFILWHFVTIAQHLIIQAPLPQFLLNKSATLKYKTST